MGGVATDSLAFRLYIFQLESFCQSVAKSERAKARCRSISQRTVALSKRRRRLTHDNEEQVETIRAEKDNQREKHAGNARHDACHQNRGTFSSKTATHKILGGKKDISYTTILCLNVNRPENHSVDFEDENSRCSNI